MKAPKEKKHERRALIALPAIANSETGYKKPPETTRFKPGQSGNPRGRPKGAKNKLPALHEERMKSIVIEEAYRTIKVNDGKKQVTVPMAQAIVRSLAVNAVKGNQRAQRLFTELLSSTEQANKRLHDEWLDSAMTYKIEWERELERRERLGIVAPDPIPHPDHIVIDMRTGQVQIKGPFTKEQKAELDLWKSRKVDFEEELADDLRMLAEEEDPKMREIIQESIVHTKRVLETIRKVVPD